MYNKKIPKFSENISSFFVNTVIIETLSLKIGRLMATFLWSGEMSDDSPVYFVLYGQTYILSPMNQFQYDFLFRLKIAMAK